MESGLKAKQVYRKEDFVCHCGFSTSYKKAWTVHQRRHEQEQCHCSTCSLDFDNEYDYLAHLSGYFHSSNSKKFRTPILHSEVQPTQHWTAESDDEDVDSKIWSMDEHQLEGRLEEEEEGIPLEQQLVSWKKMKIYLEFQPKITKEIKLANALQQLYALKHSPSFPFENQTSWKFNELVTLNHYNTIQISLRFSALT